MRGEILYYDQIQGFGFIAGADGNRYTFRREDMRGPLTPAKGVGVEFRASGDQARNVSAHADQTSMNQAPANQAPMGQASMGRAAAGRPTGPVTGPATGSATGPAVGPAVEPVTERAADPAAASAAAGASGRPQPAPPGHFGRNGTLEQAGSTGMWFYFRQAITSNYANFSGRARRKEYWSYVLFMMLAMIAVFVGGLLVDAAVGNLDHYDPAPVVTGIAAVLFILASIVPSIAIAVRRQHDIGLSGWFYLLILLPSLGGLILFVFSLIPSQMRDNKWGPVPAGVVVPPTYAPPAVPS